MPEELSNVDLFLICTITSILSTQVIERAAPFCANCGHPHVGLETEKLRMQMESVPEAGRSAYSPDCEKKGQSGARSPAICDR